jgi:menaquinol-cytochrome c reductase iron-sulfur subunit
VPAESLRVPLPVFEGADGGAVADAARQNVVRVNESMGQKPSQGEVVNETPIRRNLLQRGVMYGGSALAALMGLPALLAALSPAFAGRSSNRWRFVGPLTEFPVDTVRQANVRVGRSDSSRSLAEKGVYVWRKAPDEVVVFSRNCTDLSCPVNFDSGSECFFCPCHGGIFAKDGAPLAGPPNKPLFRYQHRLQNGNLEIDLSSLPPIT